MISLHGEKSDKELLGDKSTSSLESNLEGLASALVGDLDRHKKSIIASIILW